VSISFVSNVILVPVVKFYVCQLIQMRKIICSDSIQNLLKNTKKYSLFPTRARPAAKDASVGNSRYAQFGNKKVAEYLPFICSEIRKSGNSCVRNDVDFLYSLY